MSVSYESIQERAPNGVLSPEMAAQLLAGMPGTGLEGETGAEPEPTAASPTAAPATDTPADQPDAQGKPEQNEQKTNDGGAPAAAAVNEDELTDETAVVLAKDGKHHIPFARLQEARQGEQSQRQRADALQAQLEQSQQRLDELSRQAQQRADAGQSATRVDNMAAAAQAAVDQGVDPEIFGDFSEKALAQGIAKLVNMRVGEVTAQMRGELQQALQPVVQSQQMTAEQAHVAAIKAAHPDVGSIVESKELQDWKQAQPSYAQAAIDQVIAGGSTQQVIELLDQFKASTGKTQAAAPVPARPPMTAAQVQAAAQKAIAEKRKPVVPNSLSDIPGGTLTPQTRDQAMKEMEPLELMDAMNGMTPEQISDWLNRNV